MASAKSRSLADVIEERTIGNLFAECRPADPSYDWCLSYRTSAAHRKYGGIEWSTRPEVAINYSSAN